MNFLHVGLAAFCFKARTSPLAKPPADMRTPSHLRRGKKKKAENPQKNPQSHPELSNKTLLAILATKQVNCPLIQDIFNFLVSFIRSPALSIIGKDS